MCPYSSLAKSNLPLLTIGIPVKNRMDTLPKVLKALERLEYPKDKIKVIFVDSYSKDVTFQTLEEWKRKSQELYHTITLIQKHTNIPQARNLCVKHMDGKYLLFWDSDVIPPMDLLVQMVDILESNDEIGIIGADYLYERKSILMKLQGEPLTNKHTHAVYLGFTLVSGEVFEKVGGFNELLDVGEDTEFGIRVSEKTSYKIMWAPKPVLHLKRVDEVKSFTTWLSYNFYVRGKQYAESFHKLPLLLRLRIVYYALLPPVLAFSLLFAYYIGAIWMPLMFIIYLLPGLLLAARSSNIRRGAVSFLTFNIPTGIALAYGACRAYFKHCFGAQHKKA